LRPKTLAIIRDSRFHVPAMAVATLLFLIVLHECGHVLAGWATGGRLLEFDVLTLQPRVRISSAASASHTAVRALAGSAAVLLAWTVALLALPRRTRLEPVRLTATFFAGIELLGWFLSALLHSIHPQRNDAGKFLKLTAADPWALVFVCLLIACAGTRLFLKTAAATQS
jgi:hypothetical protein